MSVQIEGIFGFLLLVIDIWAIVRIIQSNASTGKKVLWIVLILLLPLLGVILWWFLGPKG
jgi:succinate dehydrogenase/fumarate reductase cytochrome b subunit